MCTNRVPNAATHPFLSPAVQREGMSADAPDDDPPEEDIDEVAAELSDAMRELRDDLQQEAPSGPAGLPRPPSPREVLRFADEVAIPAAIAILEANIKILEAIQRGIRLADRERQVRERTEDARSRAADVSETTVNRLDTALSDLQRVVEEGSLPNNEAARDVLDEARSLRDRLDDQVQSATDTADSAREAERRIDIESEQPTEDDESDVDRNADSDTEDDGSTRDESDDSGATHIDVDSELESIKRQYGDEPEPPDSESMDGGDESKQDGAGGQDEDNNADNDEDDAPDSVPGSS